MSVKKKLIKNQFHIKVYQRYRMTFDHKQSNYKVLLSHSVKDFFSFACGWRAINLKQNHYWYSSNFSMIYFNCKWNRDQKWRSWYGNNIDSWKWKQFMLFHQFIFFWNARENLGYFCPTKHSLQWPINEVRRGIRCWCG